MSKDRKAATRAKWLETMVAQRRDFDGPGSAEYWSPSLDTASRDELVALQNAKLGVLTPFLYENSDFYRRRFDGLGLPPRRNLLQVLQRRGFVHLSYSGEVRLEV